MLRKLFCVFAIILLLPLGAAQAAPENWMVDEDGLKVFFKHRDEWTFVTPDTVEDHIDLCTSRGYTAQEVRDRFASGRVVWEAYHKRIPDGLVRYEVWSDEQTRNIWDLNRMPAKDRKAWLDSLGRSFYTGKYTFIRPSYQSMGRENHIVLTGVIQNPPAAYESGYGSLFIRNGQAMLTAYFQTSDRASMRRYNKQAFDFSSHEIGYLSWNESVFVPELLPEAVDLTAADPLIVNAHTGELTLRGVSEKGAAITAAWGNRTADTDAKNDGSFSLSVPVETEGTMAVSLTAAKKGRTDNHTGIFSIPVDNGTARLTLTEYPHMLVDNEPITVSGLASPDAVVFVTLNDENPIMLYTDSDGTFTHTFEDAKDFIPQALTVTANEQGLRDATVTLPFARTYITDIDKGIATFKADTIRVNSAQLTAHPEDYVGKFIRMEFRTTGVSRGPDGLTLEAKSMDSDKRRPMILKSANYLDDAIIDGMNITAYGIADGVDTDTGLPLIRLLYVSYLKIIYR